MVTGLVNVAFLDAEAAKHAAPSAQRHGAERMSS
jgi:hypothetical protein